MQRALTTCEGGELTARKENSKAVESAFYPTSSLGKVTQDITRGYFLNKAACSGRVVRRASIIFVPGTLEPIVGRRHRFQEIGSIYRVKARESRTTETESLVAAQRSRQRLLSWGWSQLSMFSGPVGGCLFAVDAVQYFPGALELGYTDGSE
ncbi:hypothetical protein PENSPDRAFT_2390 [Peniophora sp. CONT]|nr:hypothetical protein PENSPDRAFT_2390 [Peniophora sp. CONT]